MTGSAHSEQEKNLATLPAAGQPCPMVDFVNLLSGKWAIPILYRLILMDAPVRFGELQRAVAPIAQKELTRQLRQFERRGLVTRQIFPQVPPRVEYQITPLGKTLRPTLDSLADWMRSHAPQLISGAAPGLSDSAPLDVESAQSG
ncbi:putative transcriptional regulator [Serratia sp. FGI94]|nr:putative transcriptional regulator [Serratia sp. FGI94]